MRCYCGLPTIFKQCCEKFINQSKIPETAEQLMRSRFTAFKLQRFQYLVDTYQTKLPLKTSDFDTSIQWLGLKVIAIDRGEKSDSQGFVEFVAFYQSVKPEHLGKFEQLHEKSYFEKIDDKWFYINGAPLVKIKLVRNEPCFCNSGKKYKKCHGV